MDISLLTHFIQALLSDPVGVSALIGQVMPFIVEFVNKYVPDGSRWHLAATGLVSLALGAVAVYMGGNFDMQHLAVSFAVIMTSAQGAYHYWFKPTGIQDKMTVFMKTDK